MADLGHQDISRNMSRAKMPAGADGVPDAALRRRIVDEQRADAGIIIVMVLMLCFGLVMLFSASMSASISQDGAGTSYLFRQLFANTLGLIAIFFLTKFNIKVFDKPQIAAFFYFLTILLIFLTYFTKPINGAKRWLQVPLFGTFQPSELAKIVIVYTLACYHSHLNKMRAIGKFPREKGLWGAFKSAFMDLILPMIIVMVPMVLVLFQPHFSGFGILLMISVITLIASGAPLKSWIISLLLASIIFAAGLGLFFAVKPLIPEKYSNLFAHVETRINIFQQDEDVDEAAIYQSRQSLIAIGSGGLTGVGIGQGKQKNNYLPEGHNDYIFSNIVEETGLIGGVSIMVLFLIFFVLGLRITFRASSVYAQIVAGGITSLITVQALLNLAVNVQVIPPTGISLPFFSYGGTSNLFFLIGIGLLLNVSKYGMRKTEERPQGGQ